MEKVDSVNLNQLSKGYKALESFGFPNADLFSEKKSNSLLYRKFQLSIDIQSKVSSFSISTLFKEFICKSTLVESGSTETDFRKKPGVNCYSFAIGRVPKPTINNATLTDPIPGCFASTIFAGQRQLSLPVAPSQNSCITFA